MNLSTAPLSPFQIPYIKNAKVVKLEITLFLNKKLSRITHNHFDLKTSLSHLKQFLLLENTWIHTFSILDIELQI